MSEGTHGLFLPPRLASVPENPDLFGTFAGEVEQGAVNRCAKSAQAASLRELHSSVGSVFAPIIMMPDSLTKTTPESGTPSYFGAPWSVTLQSEGSFRCSFSSDSTNRG